jgi:LysR family cyn operon transcriptional activator
LSQAGTEFRVYASRSLKEIEVGRMALADLSGLQSGKLLWGLFHFF